MAEQAREMGTAASLPLKVGIDIGSKTIKVVVLEADNTTRYAFYDRHLSNVKQTMLYALKRCRPYCAGHPLTVGVTGSAGIQFAGLLDLPFIQEVLADKLALEKLLPETDVAIELGGEDSKILFLSGGEELRMNNTCAGGTGGFIDTIAGMFDLNAEEFNSLALGAQTIFPIASRCAVFAQSDVRPLLNEGVSRYDIAASVFAAVATQCISGLACGRKIAGRVALLGGPFHFLSALRGAFKKALGSDAVSVTCPLEAHLFVAKGAAFSAEDAPAYRYIEILAEQLENIAWCTDDEEKHLPALFSSPEEYATFTARHSGAKPVYGQLNGYEGRAYLGIDSGSTTLKCVLMGEQGEFLFTYYERVAGDLVEAVELMLQSLYKRLPRLHDGRPALTIVHTCVVGYGEELILAAFRADSGEVETAAHLRAARACVPDVDMVLDIGGQDIKYLTVREGALDTIVLNEACSSGCGALIGGFAYSMNVKLPEFTEAALFAEKPVDLGSRCTVFMTSRVRHAQKEGASVGEISAGLAYSVVHNALFKVIRLQDASALGRHIVVQGGTFQSNAILRAFEKITGREVYRSGASEYMGAFGAALIARERAETCPHTHTKLLTARELQQLSVTRSTRPCTLCANRCVLTVSEFSQSERARPADTASSAGRANAKSTRGRWNNFDAVVLSGEHEDTAAFPDAESARDQETRRLIVGNRCMRPCAQESALENVKITEHIDMYAYTYERLFARESLALSDAPRGAIGVLRALGSYDDYPLWHTFLTHLGFSVVLSDASSRSTYLRGAETILSESACYPIKISNGHLLNVVDKGVPLVFYPSIRRGFSEKLPCSVLAHNPLVLGLNIEAVYSGKVQLLSPRINYCDFEGMRETLYASFQQAGIVLSRKELAAALEEGLKAYHHFWTDIRHKGEEAIQQIREQGGKGIVLAGRPYHLDPEMHHGLPEQLKSFGLSVLTTESVAHLGATPPLYVDDLWDYPSRQYRAASFVADCDCLDFLELYSFGCGLDAVTCDQIQEIFEQRGRLFTSLKIDEMSDLAATRIRMRSMLAALAGNTDTTRHARQRNSVTERTLSRGSDDATPSTAATKTSVLVNWLPGFAEHVADVFSKREDQIIVLPQNGKKTVLRGLACTNNDACFSSVYAVGQVMDVVLSGEGLPDYTEVLLPSTCVNCRAGDLPGLMRKALADAGFTRLLAPASGERSAEGESRGTSVRLALDASISPSDAQRIAQTLLLSDMQEQLLRCIRPYLTSDVSLRELEQEYLFCIASTDEFSFASGIKTLLATAASYMPHRAEQRPCIALVGTAPTLFNATINNDTVLQIEAEGCQARIPWYSDFVLYKLAVENLAGNVQEALVAGRERIEHEITRSAAGRLLRLLPPQPLEYYRSLACSSGLVSEYETSGAGWLSVGHVLDALEKGERHIVYAHSFGCLPAHTLGRGIFRALRSRCPDLSIVSIEYDPGASLVNQSNRLKLLTELAKKHRTKV